MTGVLTAISDWQDLPLAQQVAQMVVVRASGHLFDHQIQYPQWEPPGQVLQRWVQDLGVGGVILLGGSAVEVGLRTQQLQDWATIPLLIAADIEEGVGQRFAGATWFAPPMAVGSIATQSLDQALTYATQMGAAIAEEALAIGINWVLAPVVDVNNNPLNPVINVRAWGETAEVVSQLATAFVQGAQQHPVLTTAKHFPGHGDTAIDSHLELPVLPHSRERLAQIELPPFQAAIAAGVDAVMSAHLKIPALDAVYPATLSPKILTDELRQNLGFEGLIVTDALIMGAITNVYGVNEAPVLAVEAGVDIVLMPANPEGAIEAICAAVETGRIPLERIHASLERIWAAKQRISTVPIAGDASHAWEQVPPPTIDPAQLTTHLACPQAQATSIAILQDSLKLHRPYPSQLEQYPDELPRRNLIVVDDIFNSPFLSRQAPAITVPQQQGYTLQLVDRHTPTSDFSVNRQLLPTLFQVFIRGNPFRGSTELTQIVYDWLHFLVRTDQLLAVAIYGSPYVLEQLIPQLPPNIPYVFCYGQMATAQTIALSNLLNSTNETLITSTPHARIFTD